MSIIPEKEKIYSELEKFDSVLVPFLIFLTMIFFNSSIAKYFVGYQGLDKQLVPILFIASIFPFILLFKYFNKKGLIEFKDIGFTRTKWKSNLFFGLLTGMFLGLVAWAFVLMGHFQPDTIPKGDGPYFFLGYFFSVCISAPLWEEIAFRGLFLNAIEKLFNWMERLFNWVKRLFNYSEKGTEKPYAKDIFIILFVSLVFLIIHSDRAPKPLFVIFLISLAYTTTYYKTRNIILPIVSHSVYNLFIFILLSN